MLTNFAKLIIFLFCNNFFITAIYSQQYETNINIKRANIWHFGYGAGLDFNSEIPITLTGGQTKHTWEGFSTLCDTSGNLLFYSDGETIWNNNHEIVENGTGIISHQSSTQASLFIQHPNNDSLIYFFTSRPNNFSNPGIRFSVINIKLNNNKGSVIVKNKLILTPTTEKLTSINHSNGNDIWILAHGYTTNSYFSFLLTKEGLIECPIESITGNILEDIPPLWFLNTQGNLIANYQGNQVAAAILHTGKVEVFDFNNQSGFFSIIDTIFFSSKVYCLAYNNIGNRLFIQTINQNSDTSFIYYYESKKLNLIAKYPHGQIQYMVNFNEILYLGNMDSSFISSIENINDSFPTFIQKAVDLTPSISSVGLNNFNPSYHYTPSVNYIYDINCINNSIEFFGQDTFSATNHNWLISKLGKSITDSIKNPLITFDDTGVYSVRYIASNGSRSDTISKSIIVHPKVPKNFLGNDTGWCNNIGNPITINAPSGMHCYEWSTGAKSSSISATDTGAYWVKITTPNFCVVYDTIIITIDSLPTVSSNFLGSEINWCENVDSMVLIKAPQGFDNYQWNTGDTTEQIWISEEGQYYVSVFNNNFCNQKFTDTLLLIFDTIPDNAINFLGENISWCENIDTLVLLTAPDGVVSYLWNSGETTKQLSVNSAGIYSATVTALNGCIISDTVNVSIDTIPHNAIAFLGSDKSWCENLDTSILLTAPDGFVSYLWNSGETSKQLSVNSAGIYSATITAPNGCIVSDTVNVSIDTIPHNAINFLGDYINWCENIDTSLLLIAPDGFLNYYWNTGETSKQISVNTIGEYIATIIASNGCVISDTIVLSFLPIPDKPIISIRNDTLFSNVFAQEYSWFRNEIRIGNNTSFIKLSDTGIYKLAVQNEWGCANVSDTLHVMFLNFGFIALEKSGVNIYPNPAKDVLFITSDSKTFYNYTINDAAGRKVKSGSINFENDNISEINIELLTKGIYFLKLENEKGWIISKFIRE
jgi:hypothetical protein